MAAPAYVASATASAATAASLDITIPPSAASGDYAVLVSSCRWGVDTPAGWTLLGGPTSVRGGNGFTVLFGKVLNGADPGAIVTLVLNPVASSRMSAVMVVYAQAELDVAASAAETPAVTSFDCPSVTTNVIDTVIVSVPAWSTDATGGAIAIASPPVGTTERGQATSNFGSSRNAGAAIGTDEQVAVGSSGVRTWTTDIAVSAGAFTVALKNAGAEPPPAETPYQILSGGSWQDIEHQVLSGGSWQ